MKHTKIIASMKRDPRSKITHLFRHLGAGKVEHVGSYESGSGACQAIGVSNANIIGYVKQIVGVVNGKHGDEYHLIQELLLEGAKRQAVKRSFVREVQRRMNTHALCQLPTKTLSLLNDQLP